MKPAAPMSSAAAVESSDYEMKNLMNSMHNHTVTGKTPEPAAEAEFANGSRVGHSSAYGGVGGVSQSTSKPPSNDGSTHVTVNCAANSGTPSKEQRRNGAANSKQLPPRN